MSRSGNFSSDEDVTRQFSQTAKDRRDAERADSPFPYIQFASFDRLTFAKEHRSLMYFIAYLIGFLILIGGLAWAAITAGAPELYVAIGSVILLGVGIITGVSRTRRRGLHGSDTDVTVIER